MRETWATTQPVIGNHRQTDRQLAELRAVRCRTKSDHTVDHISNIQMASSSSPAWFPSIYYKFSGFHFVWPGNSSLLRFLKKSVVYTHCRHCHARCHKSRE